MGGGIPVQREHKRDVNSHGRPRTFCDTRQLHHSMRGSRLIRLICECQQNCCHAWEGFFLGTQSLGTHIQVPMTPLFLHSIANYYFWREKKNSYRQWHAFPKANRQVGAGLGMTEFENFLSVDKSDMFSLLVPNFFLSLSLLTHSVLSFFFLLHNRRLAMTSRYSKPMVKREPFSTETLSSSSPPPYTDHILAMPSDTFASARMDMHRRRPKGLEEDNLNSNHHSLFHEHDLSLPQDKLYKAEQQKVQAKQSSRKRDWRISIALFLWALYIRCWRIWQPSSVV